MPKAAIALSTTAIATSPLDLPSIACSLESASALAARTPFPAPPAPTADVAHGKFTPAMGCFGNTQNSIWKSTADGMGERMLLLVASAVAFLLGIAVTPWRSWQSAREFHPGLVVTNVFGCIFMGLGLGGAAIAAVILFIQ